MLHLGNLRTAMAAWLMARSRGGGFVMRMEDLDPVTSRPEHAHVQLADLAALGLDWDGPVLVQSARREAHEAALAHLAARGLTYECYCTRAEIAAAASAAHVAPGRYPGTCRHLSARQRAERAAVRPPAVRLAAAPDAAETFTDLVVGSVYAAVDDVVLRRNDGVPAYNLAVVLDDAHQQVNQVTRGDDLVGSTPTQLHLISLLGLERPSYAHVPLVLGPEGKRLAKRDGAVTLADLAGVGVGPDRVRSVLAASFGWCEPGEPVTMQDVLERFTVGSLAREPWRFDALDLG